MEVLRRYASGSACVARDEAKRRTPALGKLAGLAVLSKDYLSVAVEEIGGIQSRLTMVAGAWFMPMTVHEIPSGGKRGQPCFRPRLGGVSVLTLMDCSYVKQVKYRHNMTIIEIERNILWASSLPG